jgi:hypothetical protein
VYIEDDIRDVVSFCEAIASVERSTCDELLGACTILILDKAGPGTEKTVLDLLRAHKRLQIVAGPFSPALGERLLERVSTELVNRSDPFGTEARKDSLDIASRFWDLSSDELGDASAFQALVDKLLRPRGRVLCDVNLPPLTFDNPKPDRLDALLKGACAAGLACRDQGAVSEDLPSQQHATLCLLSGVTVFMDTDRDLAGLEIPLAPRPLYRKTDANRLAVAEMIRRFLAESFPWSLEARVGESAKVVNHRVGRDDAGVMNKTLDLVTWPLPNGHQALSGKLVKPERELEDNRVGTKVLEKLLERYLSPHRELSALAIEGMAKDYKAQNARRDANSNTQSAAQVIKTLKDNFLDDAQGQVLPPKNIVKGTYSLGEVLAGMVRPPKKFNGNAGRSG